MKVNTAANLIFLSGTNAETKFELKWIEESVLYCHSIIDLILRDIPVDIFAILGLRNLSAFVGELFAKSLVENSKGEFRANPHQDGYPDLLLMDKDGRKLWEKLAKAGQLDAKAPFSPFRNGGIEIKATCGSVPTPKVLAKKGLFKPKVGDPRIDLMMGYDWKAHHRETNNLMSILWDFDASKAPRIMAVFFRGDLCESDWGKIVQPKTGGGRTTSVSIMPRAGVKKMYENWILVNDDRRYIEFLNKYNKDDLIT